MFLFLLLPRAPDTYSDRKHCILHSLFGMTGSIVVEQPSRRVPGSLPAVTPGLSDRGFPSRMRARWLIQFVSGSPQVPIIADLPGQVVIIVFQDAASRPTFTRMSKRSGGGGFHCRRKIDIEWMESS